VKDCVIVFVRHPEPGRVKTRLAGALTPEGAARFYKALVEEKLAELAAGCAAEVLVCCTPASAVGDVEAWLGPGFRYAVQRGADLGERMANAIAESFAMGFARCVLVGSDIPGLTPSIVEEGLSVLTESTASIGPAADGGYYLIGFHRDGLIPAVFDDMRWSTPSICRETVRLLDECGVTVHRLATLQDIDTVDDLERLIALGDDGPLKGLPLAVARDLLARGEG